jgi:hypothetical protein
MEMKQPKKSEKSYGKEYDSPINPADFLARKESNIMQFCALLSTPDSIIEVLEPQRRKVKNKIIYLLFFSVIFFLLFAEAERMQKPGWKGTIIKEGEVTVVKNPKEPMSGSDVLFLQEELSVGKAEGKEEYLFYDIRSPVSNVDVDAQNNIYVLDIKATQVKVFDKDGHFLRTIGRKGQGPGEFEGAWKIFISSGNELIVEGLISRRLDYFNLDGMYIKRISIAQAGISDVNMDSTENIYGVSSIQDRNNPGTEVKKFDRNLRGLGTLDMFPNWNHDRDGYNPFMGSIQQHILPGDQVLIGSNREYELKVFDSQARLVKIIQKEYEPVRVTKEDIDDREKDMIFKGGSGPSPQYVKFLPPFMSFMTDDEGRIFVCLNERTKDRKYRFFNIFDAEGKCLAKQVFRFWPVLWKKGKLYAVEEDEDGNQFLKRYNVIWKF